MQVSPICYNPGIIRPTSFKGAKEEVISEGFKEFVSEALPVYKAGRALYKISEGYKRCYKTNCWYG